MDPRLHGDAINGNGEDFNYKSFLLHILYELETTSSYQSIFWVAGAGAFGGVWDGADLCVAVAVNLSVSFLGNVHVLCR